MAKILKTVLNGSGNWINSPESLGTITLDSDVTYADVNLYLPNNTNLYDKEFRTIPSGSTMKVLMDTKWYLCQFNAEIGTADANGNLSGIWKVMAEIKYIV
jgi:hypothetical protein